MKNPDKTQFNKKQIYGWTLTEFKQWWKLHGFDGDAKEWFYKITGKKKAE